jgi:hypothetical protein
MHGSPQPPRAIASNPNIEEVGLYLMDGKKPIQLQTTGFSKHKVSMFELLGSATTFGMYKVKQKAVVTGPTASVRSQNRRPVVLLHASEGSSPGDYVAIKLEKKKKTRQVLVGSMSILGGLSGGFEEDTVVKFTSTKLKPRKYLLRFDSDLPPGEYAFYPIAGLQASSTGVTTSGKLYDFGIDP